MIEERVEHKPTVGYKLASSQSCFLCVQPVTDPLRPLVDIQEGPDAMSSPMKVIQSGIPQRLPCERIQS